MIQVTRKTNGVFTVKLDVPEQVLLRKIAEAYAIPVRDAMGSVVLRGMASITKLISVVDKHNGSTKDNNQDI